MTTAMKWYQVALTPGSQPGRFEVRQRVQANNPDAALHAVMRLHRVPFTNDASIWLLGRCGMPTKRSNVSCRLPAERSI